MVDDVFNIIIMFFGIVVVVDIQKGLKNKYVFLILYVFFYDLKKKKVNGNRNNLNSFMNLICYWYIFQKNKILRKIDGKDDYFDCFIYIWIGDFK